jgi:hypothetical protein
MLTVKQLPLVPGRTHQYDSVGNLLAVTTHSATTVEQPRLTLCTYFHLLFATCLHHHKMTMQNRILKIRITLYCSSGHQNVKHKTKKLSYEEQSNVCQIM